MFKVEVGEGDSRYARAALETPRRGDLTLPGMEGENTRGVQKDKVHQANFSILNTQANINGYIDFPSIFYKNAIVLGNSVEREIQVSTLGW